MSDRVKNRSDYEEGWDTWNIELLMSTLAEDFVFDDPALPEPVTKAHMPDYIKGWADRVKQLGGTGEIESTERVTVDEDGAIVAWNWWSFVGTKYEGSAVTRTTDQGVQYERITYYPETPVFSD